MANRAPGRLGLVQDFVNTLEVDLDRDRLSTPDAVAAWLRERDLAPDEPSAAASEADRTLAVALREALRRLLLANNGGPVHEADLALLDRLALDSGLRPRFLAIADVHLEPSAPGVTGALGRLVAAVAAAMQDGTWSRLKACADGTCLWVFYDLSKNHSGHWCSMGVCGNRAKARQFRRRRRSVTSS